MDGKKQRREGEKKFRLSLSELEALWQAEEEAEKAAAAPPEALPESDWEAALADAAADIEQFMTQQPDPEPEAD